MIAFVLLMSLIPTVPNPDSCAVTVPLRPEWAWHYAGSALWSHGDGTGTDSATVSWTMTVVDARDVGNTRVALVRGFVDQLAWYRPSEPPRLSLLICRGLQLFGLELGSDSAARSAYSNWSDSLLHQADLLLDLPLHDGQLFGQSPPRADALYGWAVLALRPEGLASIPASCGKNVGVRFQLSYGSLPDHAIIEWQPGLGITRYAYGHHGTPAAAEVHLTGCEGPAP